MDFPQFYLHYDAKTDKTLKVDRESETSAPFVVVIALDEELARRLLNGDVNEANLMVNKFANPPYVVDKGMFPIGSSFNLIYSSETLKIHKIVAKTPNYAELKANKQSCIEVDPRCALSLLAGDTSFDDWEILIDGTGQVQVMYDQQNNEASNLFKNRTDFLSLAEIDMLKSKEKQKSQFPKICDIVVNYLENSIEITGMAADPEYFKDFFIAVTNKNDPSFLIKKIVIKPSTSYKFEFSGKKIDEMSFFTSRFYLPNMKIEVVDKCEGQVLVTIKNNLIIVENSIQFSDTFTNAVLVLNDKYDKSRVFRTIQLTKPGILEFDCSNIDPTIIEVNSSKLSKKFITVNR